MGSSELTSVMETFVASKVNFSFCMQMVQILLLFIHAQRDGVWKLHLHAFQHTLPLFMKYDHTNYARWGTMPE